MAVKDLVKHKQAKKAAVEEHVDIPVLRGRKGDKGDTGPAGKDGKITIEHKYEKLPEDLVTEDKMRHFVRHTLAVAGGLQDAPRDGQNYVRSGGNWVVSSGEGGGGPTAWGAITGTLASQSDLNTALSGKAATSHNHDGVYAPATHTHAISDVTGLTASLASKADASTVQTALDAKAPLSHTHTSSDITNFAEAVDDRVATLLVAGSGVTLTYDDTANTLTVAASGGGSDPWTYVKLGSTFSTSSGTAVDITGMSFTPAANKIYEIEGVFMTRTDVATIGPRVGITWPTGLTDSVVEIVASASATTAVLAYGNDAAERTNLNTGVVNTTSSWPVLIKALIVVGASPSGNIQFRLTTETAGTIVYVRAGSYFKYREI